MLKEVILRTILARPSVIIEVLTQVQPRYQANEDAENKWHNQPFKLIAKKSAEALPLRIVECHRLPRDVKESRNAKLDEDSPAPVDTLLPLNFCVPTLV